jgi:hypothetical protein
MYGASDEPTMLVNEWFSSGMTTTCAYGGADPVVPQISGLKRAALSTVPTGAAVLVTRIGPPAAAAGTVTTSRLGSVRAVIAAGVPLKLTVDVLVNPVPVTTTLAPAAPASGET